MAHKYEHISTGNGFSVKNGSTTTKVIDQTGKFVGTFTQNSVATASLDVSTIQYAEVSLTANEIKALRATPKTLVSAPGAGKIIEFVSAILLLDATATAFTETADNMAVKYTDGSGAAVSGTIEATGFIDQTADTMTTATAKADAIVAKTGCENKAIVLHNTGDGEYATGTGVMRVKVAYRVHTTGW